MKKNSDKKQNTPVENGDVKKGYNEKNPGQPQGAFKPDSTNSPEEAPKKSTTVKKK